MNTLRTITIGSDDENLERAFDSFLEKKLEAAYERLFNSKK